MFRRLKQWFESRQDAAPCQRSASRRRWRKRPPKSRRLLVESLAARDLFAAHPWAADPDATYCEPMSGAAWEWTLGETASFAADAGGDAELARGEPEFAAPAMEELGGPIDPGDPPPLAPPTVDLDTDSDHNGRLERSSVEDSREWRHAGRLVHVNDDDDNDNGLPDWQDAPFVDGNGRAMADDDLVEFRA